MKAEIRMHFPILVAGSIGLVLLAGCQTSSQTGPVGPFGEDLKFLKRYTDVIVLKDPKSAAQVAVVPGFQARVMTSSAHGRSGDSYGWLNRKQIAGGERQPHINVYGGEDRFWLGPVRWAIQHFFREGCTVPAGALANTRTDRLGRVGPRTEGQTLGAILEAHAPGELPGLGVRLARRPFDLRAEPLHGRAVGGS